MMCPLKRTSRAAYAFRYHANKETSFSARGLGSCYRATLSRRYAVEPSEPTRIRWSFVVSTASVSHQLRKIVVRPAKLNALINPFQS
jgi:hypothetical protein